VRTRYNEDLFLWAIATLQPASIGDALAVLREIFPEVKPLPKVTELEPIISRWIKEGLIVRVHGKSRLYSVSHRGNRRLSIPLRRHRDKTRLFLLKAARGARIRVSGGAPQGLVGASPSVDGSIGTQEGSRPISSDGVPRRPRNPVRTYWPRVVKQLQFKVGSVPRSPDTRFDYYSFPSVSAIHMAGASATADDDLSITDLGVAIGISPRLLTSFTHKPVLHYRKFEIGKRGGGRREINSPRTFLKIVQYWLADYALYSLPVHESCHAYQMGRSILTNASRHVGKGFVGNIDIEGFFGSITARMVRAVLLENGFGDQLSKTISRLTTLGDGLPQGAPTSPLLSNAVLFSFDEEMTKYAKEFDVEYTRYADDITISGNDPRCVSKAIREATARLGVRGLKINDKKTRMSRRSGQQRVTGIVVNEQPQPPRAFRRRIRAMFHQADLHPEKFAQERARLRGYLNYLKSFPVLRGSSAITRYEAILGRLEKVSQ
jgi:retron-type reverse transcriptase